MSRDYQMRWGGRVSITALLLFLLAAPGCTGSGNGGVPATSAPAGAAAASPPPPAATSPSLKDKIANFFTSRSDKTPQPVANAQSDVECPFIDIRQGASTLTLPPPPPDGSNEAMTLKYQASFVRAARECAVNNGQMVMKIGVQGRVIVGPAGGPGHVDVPLRIAVVDAPASGLKTITTKLVIIPVDVTNDDGADFTHIEEGLTFPMPPAAELGNYVVYIGFDPYGAGQLNNAKAKPAAKPKLKPKPNLSAPTG
jgi:hypothetical protein